MATFLDNTGREWFVEFDAFILGELRDQQKIDLVDLSGQSYLSIETDVVSLVRALSVICRDRIAELKLDSRGFAKLIVGEAITRATEAVRGAATAFFPAKTWSELQLALQRQREARSQFEQLKPMLRTLNDPDMPDGFREGVMLGLREMISTRPTDSPSAAESSSASTPPAIPSISVSASPDLSEFHRVP